MNKILTTLILAGLIFACKPKSDNIHPIKEANCKKLTYTYTNSKNNQLLGKDIYVYDVKDKLIEIQGLRGYTNYEYDAKDNLLKTTKYSKNQGVETKISETEYSYNAANQVTRQLTSTLSDQMRLEKQSEYLYEYHANGKMKKYTWFYYSWVSDRPYIVSEFNENEKEILTYFYDGIHKKFEYNAGNLLIKETTYDAKNNPVSESLYEYNSQNQYIKVSDYHSGILSDYATYEYNSKGEQISMAIYNANGTLISKRIKEYTGESYKIINYDAQNKLTSYSSIEVLNGLKMKESAYSGNKLAYYIIYAYDSHNNKIKQEEFNDALETPLREEWTYQCD